eukprot:6190007-Pleurochrysis_carterae.AAC.1
MAEILQYVDNYLVLPRTACSATYRRQAVRARVSMTASCTPRTVEEQLEDHPMLATHVACRSVRGQALTLWAAGLAEFEGEIYVADTDNNRVQGRRRSMCIFEFASRVANSSCGFGFSVIS